MTHDDEEKERRHKVPDSWIPGTRVGDDLVFDYLVEGNVQKTLAPFEQGTETAVPDGGTEGQAALDEYEDG